MIPFIVTLPLLTTKLTGGPVTEPAPDLFRGHQSLILENSPKTVIAHSIDLPGPSGLSLY